MSCQLHSFLFSAVFFCKIFTSLICNLHSLLYLVCGSAVPANAAHLIVPSSKENFQNRFCVLRSRGCKADVSIVRSFHPESQSADAISWYFIEVVILAISSTEFCSQREFGGKN